MQPDCKTPVSGTVYGDMHYKSFFENVHVYFYHFEAGKNEIKFQKNCLLSLGILLRYGLVVNVSASCNRSWVCTQVGSHRRPP